MKTLQKKPWFQHFLKDQRGVSAMEFALIAPLMVVMFFGIAEITTWLQANRKMTTVASSVGDLVTQETQLTDGEIADIMNCAAAIMQPYDAGNAVVVVSSVVADADGETTVAWSDSLHGAARAVGSDVTLPEGLVQPLQSVVMTEVSFTYQTVFGMFLTSGITASDAFYQKPRRSTHVVRVP